MGFPFVKFWACPRKLPLRMLLVMPFVVLTVGTVGLVGYLSYCSGQQTVQNLVNRLLIETGDRIDQNLDNYLSKPSEVVRNNAAAIKLGILNYQDLSTIEPYFWQQMQVFSSLSAVAIATEKKEILIIEKQDDGTWAIRLRDKSTNNIWDNYLADNYGNRIKLLRRSKTYDPHNDPPTNPWYRRTKVAGRSIWQINVSLANPNRPALVAVNFLPFFDQENTFQGVVGSSLSLKHLSNFLQNLGIAKTGQAFIIERNGQMIGTSTGEIPFRQGLVISPLEENLGKNTNPKYHRLNILNSNDSLSQAVAKHLLEQFGSLDQIKGRHQLKFKTNGQDYFILVEPLKNNQNLDWLRLVVIPESDFTSEIQTNINTTFLLCLLTLFAATGLAILIARLITNPILDLNKAAKEIANGNFDQDIKIQTIDEVGELAEAFNRMAKQLHYHNRNLENLVEERTISLERANKQLEEEITDRDLNAQILRQERDFSQTLIQSSPAFYVAIDADGQTLMMNDLMLQVLGYSLAEAIGIDYLNKFVPESEHAAVSKIFEQRIVYKKRTISENHIQTKDGRLFLVEWRGTPILDEDGNFKFFYSLGIDITERKRIDEALRISESRFRSIFETALIGITIVSIDGKFISINPAFCQLLGYTELELADLTFHNISYPEDLEADISLYQKLIDKEIDCYQIEKRYICKNGDIIWGLLSVSLVFDAFQKPLYSIGLTQNITARKIAEDALRQSEAKQSALLRALPDLIMTVTDEGIYSDFIITNTFKVIGETGGFVGTRVGDSLPEELAQRRMNAIDRVLKTGSIQIYEQEIYIDNAIQTEEVRVVPYQQKQVLILVRDISDRKIAEAKLIEREYFIKQVADHSPQILYILNPVTWNNLYANRQTIEILGYTPEEFQQGGSQFFMDILHPDDLPLLFQNADHWKIALDGEVLTTEYRMRHKNGNWVWLRSRDVVFARDENGRVIEILGTAQDISDRKLIEESLKLSEARLKAFLNNASAIIYIKDLEGKHLLINSEFERVWKISQAEFLGKTDYDIFPLEVADAFRANDRKTMFGRIAIRFEETLEIHGENYSYLATKFPLLDSDGLPYAVAGISMDISDRKRAEQELVASKNLREAIFNESTDAIFLVDPVSMTILDCNRRAVEMFEADRKEELIGIEGHTLRKHPISKEEIVLKIQEFDKTGYWTREVECITKKGNYFWGSLAVKLVRIAEQDIHLTHITDITERYLIDRMKSEFISVVSHELRTPLTSIYGALSLLSDGLIDPLSERGQKILAIAVKGASRLVRLVNDILDLERLESGKVKLQKQVFNVGELITTVTELMQIIANEAGISLEVFALDISINADFDKIIQVLTNLLSNAIKFSSSNSIVYLSVKPQEYKGKTNVDNTNNSNINDSFSFIRFTVRDRGRGIPNNQLETVFERFHQVDASDSRQKGGTGLGLAICRNIVNQHGGEIWAESQLGEGSSFSFTLPLTSEN